MSHKHLERSEVLNLVYTRQADRMADAYDRLMADFSQMTAWGRGLESDLSSARAELMLVRSVAEDNATLALRYDATKSMLDGCAKEIEEMEAEVERLQSIHSIDSIGIEQLKAEVERLTADLNKMTKTPDGVDYVEVNVGFWTKYGSRLPSSYSTFWSNAKGVQS